MPRPRAAPLSLAALPWSHLAAAGYILRDQCPTSNQSSLAAAGPAGAAVGLGRVQEARDGHGHGPPRRRSRRRPRAAAPASPSGATSTRCAAPPACRRARSRGCRRGSGRPASTASRPPSTASDARPGPYSPPFLADALARCRRISHAPVMSYPTVMLSVVSLSPDGSDLGLASPCAFDSTVLPSINHRVTQCDSQRDPNLGTGRR